MLIVLYNIVLTELPANLQWHFYVKLIKAVNLG